MQTKSPQDFLQKAFKQSQFENVLGSKKDGPRIYNMKSGKAKNQLLRDEYNKQNSKEKVQQMNETEKATAQGDQDADLDHPEVQKSRALLAKMRANF